MRITSGNTTLETGVYSIRGNKDLTVSNLPAIRPLPPQQFVSEVPAEDGLFVGFGGVKNIIPYCMVDGYSWSDTPCDFPCVTLENEHLKAVFLPRMGGRLWKLFDKDLQRDVIYENPLFRPGFLGICNAWAAGGVEFNFGVRGHDAYTLSPLFTDVLQDTDGTPVLRFYEFNRIRQITYQLDFFLPQGAKFLFNRVRVVNPRDVEVPFYYWANIAVAEHRKQRIVVPASSTYVNFSLRDGVDSLSRHPLPISKENFDATYPMNHPIAKDNFFNLDDASRRYEVVAEEDGNGMVLASTHRLQGRKLFTWGMSNGGRHWQRHLLGPGAHTYLEIQGGICKTQTECMPMPANAVWEWLEAYGSLQTTPEKIFGDWDVARQECLSRLDDALPQKFLDDTLERTRESFARKKGTRLFEGSGWGALENARRKHAGEKLLEAQLDFGEPGELQQAWVGLLEGKGFPEPKDNYLASSYMAQEEFYQLLLEAEKTAPKNWYLQAHIAINRFQREDYTGAKTSFLKSLALRPSTLAHFGLACTERLLGEKELCAEHGTAAIALSPENVSLVKEVFRNCREFQQWKHILHIYDTMLSESVQQTPMVRFLYAFAVAGNGDWRRAENIIQEDLLRNLPDIREAESTFTEIYFLIREKEAQEKGMPFDVNAVELPPEYDFRPSVPNK